MIVLSQLCRRIVSCLYLGWVLVPLHNHAATTYQLEAGSVITLSTGTTGPLSGMFTLSDAVSVPDPRDPNGEPIVFFNATAFDLQSPSVSLTLGSMPLQLTRQINNLSAPDYQWAGYLNSSGLPITLVSLSQPMAGLYDGTRFVFPEVRILDGASGMQDLGSMSFSAVAVPEPATLVLLLTALCAGFAYRRGKIHIR